MSTSQNIYCDNYLSEISQENDSLLLKELLTKNNLPNTNKLKITWLNNHPEVYRYLISRYTDSESFAETLYRIKNNIEIRPTCICCGGKVKFKGTFSKYCSVKCVANDPELLKQKEKTNLERYNCNNPLQSPEIKEKIRKTNLKRYGYEYAISSVEVKEKIKRTCKERYGKDFILQTDDFKNKSKQTCLEKYGTEYYVQTDDFKNKSKQTCLEKYGVEYATQSNEVLEQIKTTNMKRYGVPFSSQNKEIYKKIYFTNLEKYGVKSVCELDKVRSKINYNKIQETKRKHHTFNTSKIENDCYEYIIKKYPDVIRQYKSELYPFLCDFYIPSLNLYIELNNHWTHGPHPFDPNNEEDIKLLEYWKSKNTRFYDNAVKTWTERDVNKRQIAFNNNLNLIEIKNIEELTALL